jgi:hypothetical protein
MNWKSSTGTCSKNAWCSLCGNGHKTGVGCWLVYQFLHPPTLTVPGKAAPRRTRNFSVAGTVGDSAAGACLGDEPHDAGNFLVEAQRHRDIVHRREWPIKHEEVWKARHSAAAV